MLMNIMETTQSEMKGFIAVYSNINRLSTCLKKKMPNLQFHEVIPGSTDYLKEIQRAHILIADYNLLAPTMYQLPTVKWVQGTWAGVEVLLKQYDRSKKLPYVITRFSGDYFGSLMGEYVVAAIVNKERSMENVMNNRREGVWLKEPIFQLNVNDHRGICDLTIGILGLGAIGKDIAKVLKVLKAQVWGAVRSVPSENERLDYIDKYFSMPTGDGSTSGLPDLLKHCDYVINVLPSTPQTAGLLNGDVLKHCQEKKTIFINIGRGSIIREKDLVHALEEKWLGGAILDVFEEEPLPSSSALWKMPQVMITPHIAGVTKAEHVAEVFKVNYEKFLAGQPLNYVIDLDKGY